MKYAVMADDGLATALYDQRISRQVPPGAVEVTDAEYEHLVAASVRQLPLDAAMMRARRWQLLAESDWTQMADVHLGTDAKTAWAVYRQALRDLPASLVDGEAVWPVAP